MTKTATAGNKGGRVRSDCFVTLDLTDNGGIQIEIQSKVGALFGEDIRQTANNVLDFFEIKNAKLHIEDKGSLPYVLAARIEAAVRQLIETDEEYLFDVIAENKYTTAKDVFRFSRLYLPGNSPAMMLNAGIHKPDGIILDLEDSVAFAKKPEAQLLIRNVLCKLDFYGAERMVRINQYPLGLKDLKYVVPHHVNLLLVPKCESAEQIRKIDEEIANLRKLHEFDYPIHYMPIIESALGVEKSYEIATASENVVALALGLEDLTADLGVRRTKEGSESLYARTRVVNACKAAGIQPIDSVFSDVADMDGLSENVRISKSLGFEGMGCIHPRQIRVIKQSFAPEKSEIDKAKKIVLAFIDATERGLGVVSLGSKMIDPPVVKRAETTIQLAVNLGVLAENWIEAEKE